MSPSPGSQPDRLFNVSPIKTYPKMFQQKNQVQEKQTLRDMVKMEVPNISDNSFDSYSGCNAVPGIPRPTFERKDEPINGLLIKSSQKL